MNLRKEIKRQRRRKIWKTIIIISSICMVVSILSLYTLIGLVYQPRRSINNTYIVEMDDGTTRSIRVKATWVDRNNLFYEDDYFTNLEITVNGQRWVTNRSELPLDSSPVRSYGYVRTIGGNGACDIWIDHDGDWIVIKSTNGRTYYVCREDNAPRREKILSLIGETDE